MTVSQVASLVNVYSPVDIGENNVRLILNFHWIKNCDDVPSVMVIAQGMSDSTTIDYRLETSEKDFLKKYPTIESLLLSFSENPEWNDLSVSSCVLYACEIYGNNGLYSLPEKIPCVVVDNTSEKYFSTEDLIASHHARFESRIKERTKRKMLGHQYFHEFDDSKLTKPEFDSYWQIGVDVELFNIVSRDGQDTQGIIYIANFPEGESLMIMSYSSVDKLKDDCPDLSSLVKQVCEFSHHIHNQEQKGLLYLQSIKGNNGIYELNKYAPYFVYNKD